MKYVVGFLLLTAGSALTTGGLLLWRDQSFGFSELWTLADGLHPLFVLIVGIAMIPPALWEIFLLESPPRDD